MFWGLVATMALSPVDAPTADQEDPTSLTDVLSDPLVKRAHISVSFCFSCVNVQ